MHINNESTHTDGLQYLGTLVIKLNVFFSEEITETTLGCYHAIKGPTLCPF